MYTARTSSLPTDPPARRSTRWAALTAERPRAASGPVSGALTYTVTCSPGRIRPVDAQPARPASTAMARSGGASRALAQEGRGNGVLLGWDRPQLGHRLGELNQLDPAASQ